MAADLTEIVKQHEEEVKTVLTSKKTLVEKAVTLRMFARRIAATFLEEMHYKNIGEFYRDYEKGTSPLICLEGEGFVRDELIILKKCPMAPLFDDYKINGKFPDYWQELTREYMETMKNEAILHPLCIVHQNFRDELAKKIPKGMSFVHSVAVACRSGSSGAIVYSDFGLMIAGKEKGAVEEGIQGMACAFYVQ